ncbi:hypothetical protein QYE77_01705 [Thermanaerothrix sp. 4228-RoL]|uniref:BioF2-like acetyltransferase domain-containing protein n=1 Tax=Thermanaerothrix solaris TaxID=3058434 RepID=A0ABU3NJD1_9CHLR|nr:hypothetical protein [Thermanaerothrix sp. 4228-RoL]MDT8896963.1 hypothetical protein [Thermanaerothrix sp. 4228-RoL]
MVEKAEDEPLYPYKVLDKFILLPYHAVSVWRYRIYRLLKGWLTQWIERAFDSPVGYLRNLSLFLGVFLWRFVHFVLRGLELDIIHVEGIEKVSGEKLSLVYVGDKSLFRQIIYRILNKNIVIKYTGRVPLWRLSDLERRIHSRVDLVFLELPRLLSHSIHEGTIIENSGNVLMVMPIRRKGKWETIHRELIKKQRLNIKRFNEAGFRLVKGDSQKDFDFYYDRMYLPMVKNRHALYADIPPRESFRQLVKKCELWYVKDPEGKRVAAMVWFDGGEVKHGLSFGVLDGDFRYEEQGALACIYYHEIRMAFEQNARLLDGTQAPPFENDGLYQHKHRWGFEPIEDPWNPNKLLIWVPNGSSSVAMGWLERMRPIQSVPSAYDY